MVLINWISDSDPYLPAPSDFIEVNRADQEKSPLELRRLARARDENVRARVASNPHTPDDVLDSFKDDTPFVRLYLLRNPNLGLEFIKKFIGDKDGMVRGQAYNILLDKYKRGDIDLSGKELYQVVSHLAPNEPNLTMAELLEDIRDTRAYLLEKRNGHPEIPDL